MKICITETSLELFGNFFKRSLPSEIKDGQTYKNLVKELYDKALLTFNKEGDQETTEVILQHLFAIPQLMLSHYGNKPGSFTADFMADVSADSQEIHKVLSQGEVGDIQAVINKFANLIGEQTIEISGAVEDDWFDAVSMTLHRLTFQGSVYDPEEKNYRSNIDDPEKQLENNTLRQVLNDTNILDYKLKMLTMADAKLLENVSNTLNYADDSRPVMILTDRNGKVLRFDSAGNPSEAGMIPLYPIKSTEAEFATNKKMLIQKKIQFGYTREEAIAEAEKEIADYLQNIEQGLQLLKEGKEVVTDIDMVQSQVGFLQVNAMQQTPVRQISNLQDITFGVEVGSNLSKQVRLYPPNTNTAWYIQQGTMDSLPENVVNAVVALFTNSSLLKEGKLLSFQTRLNLIESYIQLGSTRGIEIVKTENNLQGNKYAREWVASVILNGVKYDVGTPDQNKAFETAFKEYVSGYRLKPFKGELAKNDNRVVKDRESIIKHGQIVNFSDGPAIAYKPEISFGLAKQASLEDVIQVPMGVVNGELVMSQPMKRLDHILNHAVSNIVPNKNGEIKGSGSYLAFTPLKEKFKYDPSVLKRRRMTAVQKIAVASATTSEESFADEWYKNHPMSKILTLVMKDSVHPKGKAYLAEFFKSSITLYAGSDKTALYHEVFHAYTQAILTEGERAELYNEVRSQKGTFTTVVKARAKTLNFSEATNDEIEEYLAEEFRAYARKQSSYNNKPKSKIAQYFDKLLTYLKSFFGKRSVPEVLAYGMPELVETAFRNLYSGNISVDKFTESSRPDALNQSVETKLDFTNQEVAVVMGSMNAMMSDFVQTVLNKTTNPEKIEELSYLRWNMIDSDPESEVYKTALFQYNEIISELDKKDAHGYGVIQLEDPRVFQTALNDFVLPMFEYQLELAKKSLEENPDSALAKSNIQLLEKVISNFGDVTVDPTLYLADSDTVLGLYLNNYAFVKPDPAFQFDFDEIDNDFAEEDVTSVLAKADNSKTPFELADAKTKILLSMIKAHSENGTGDPLINRVGAPRLRNPKIIMGKVLKLTTGLITPEDMYEALENAAAKDKEIAQLLSLLGPLRTQMGSEGINLLISDHEHAQWTAFWQSVNKASLPLLQTAIERSTIKGQELEDGSFEDSKVRLDLKAGRISTRTGQILRNWSDLFNHNLQNGEVFFKKQGDTFELDVEALLNVYNQTGYAPLNPVDNDDLFHIKKKPKYKYRTTNFSGQSLPRYEADPIGFLNYLGIDLPRIGEIEVILTQGSIAHGIKAGLLTDIIDTLKNRPKGTSISSFEDLFKPYTYTNDKGEVIQVSPEGYQKELAKISEFFDDSQAGVMARTAEGEMASERPLHSSLTVAVATINKAASYQELINTPGMEFWDIENNPLIGATILTQMFNLDVTGPLRGTRNRKIKISLDSLSGSKLINGKIENGVASIDSDKTTKFITDVYDTYLGHQEIMRTDVKSTAVTYRTTFVRKGEGQVSSGAIIEMKNSRKMFSDSYKSSDLLFYDQFSAHLEAELIRITRVNLLKEMIAENPDTTFEFDKDFMERGSDFSMFELILTDPVLRKRLKNLNLNTSFTLNKVLSKDIKNKIDAQLRNYFIMRSSEIFNDLRAVLPVIDSVKEKEGTQQTDEEFKKDLLDMFTVNNFLQNVNFAALFLGDSAIYNVANEGYHKRIGGMISTGTLFRFDSVWYDYVNSNSFGYDAFAKKHISKNIDRIKERRPNYKQSQPRSYQGYLNTAVIRESKHKSVYIQHYQEMAGISPKKYESMSEADGAGFITLDAYRTLARSSDEWSDGQEDLFQAMLRDEEIDYEVMKATFPVRKYQYSGPVTTDSQRADSETATRLGMVAFHKYSLMPLIPSIIKGTKLEQLNEKMMEDGIDYTTMVSGSKLSTITKINKASLEGKAKFDDLYSDDREVLFDTEITKNKIHVRFLKRQVFIDEGYKGKINLPSQIRKMIYLGICNDGIPVDGVANIENISDEEWSTIKALASLDTELSNWLTQMESTLANMQKVLKEELLFDIGMKEDISKDQAGNEVVRYTGDNNRLLNYLGNQLRSKELLPEEVDFIIDKETGKMRNDLSTSLNSETIEKVLVTMVDKKLRRLKVSGEGFVQGTGAMWERANFKKPTAEDLAKYGTNGLRTYYLQDKDGNIITDPGKKGSAVKIAKMEIKIAMQGDFKLLFDLKDHNGKPIKVLKSITTSEGEERKVIDMEASLNNLNEALRDMNWRTEYEPLITLTGPRIPSQAPNSLEAAVVAEFLPPSAGPIIILPAEIVAKTGSDYDIDKLFLMYPNIVKIGNSIELQKFIPGINETAEMLDDQAETLRKKIKNSRVSLDAAYKQKEQKFKSVKADRTEIKDLVIEKYSLSSYDLADIKKINTELSKLKNKEGVYENMPYADRQAAMKKLSMRLDFLTQAQEEIDRDLRNYLIGAFGVDTYKELFNKEDALIADISHEIAVLNEQLDLVKTKIYGKGTKGLENDILKLFAERITMPNNFSELVKANHTEDVKPTFEDGEFSILASDLESNTTDTYNKRNTGALGIPAHEKTIARTTIFDYMYNLQKHQENSVGLDSLGIAAVASTYYAIFTRMGATLMEADDAGKTKIKELFQELKDAIATGHAGKVALIKDTLEKLTSDYNSRTLRFAHNKVIGETGNAIALGFIRNKDNKVISDLIGQLINGYVDVATDAWIFNIQGNKENTPQLLFMTMAGVPMKTAIYFTNIPMIKEYNKLKKELAGVFSGLADGSGKVYTKSKAAEAARIAILEQYKELIPKELTDLHYKTLTGLTEGSFELQDLKEMIKGEPSYRQLEAFLHYLEIEELSNDVTKFQSVTKFDTQKSASLSDHQSRIETTKTYKDKTKGSGMKHIPTWWFDKIATTSQGIMNNDAFVLGLFSQYFRLRNHPLVLKGSTQHFVSKDENEQLGLDISTLRNDFKNDFLFYLYQNSFWHSNIYDSYEFKEDPSLELDVLIDEEAQTVVYNPTLVDVKMLNDGSRMRNSWFLKDLEADLFPNTNMYLAYRLELAKTFNYTPEELKKEYAHIGDFSLTNQGSIDAFRAKIALYKSNNHIAFFNSSVGMSGVLKNLIKKHPDLKWQYDIVEHLVSDLDVRTGKSNLKLSQIKDSDFSSTYRENLDALKSHPSKEVAEFFMKFEHMAIMQTGMNRRTSFDLTPTINQELLHNVINSAFGIKAVSQALDQYQRDVISKKIKLDDVPMLGDFSTKFKDMVVRNYRKRARGFNYVSNSFDGGDRLTIMHTALGNNKTALVSNTNNLDPHSVLDPVKIFKNGLIDSDYLQQMAQKEKVYAVKSKIVSPDLSLQDKLDFMLDVYFGIDNRGEIPMLHVVGAGQTEANLSIADSRVLQEQHSIKDEMMANSSTKAIASPTSVKELRSSSTQSYIDVINRKYPTRLAGNTGASFVATDKVWVFGAGIFKSAYEGVMTEQQFTNKVKSDFDSYYVPQLEVALKAGVSVFNVGHASGIDAMTSEYLKEKGFVESVQYTKGGGYAQYTLPELVSNSLYDPTAEVIDLGSRQTFKKLKGDLAFDEIMQKIRNAKSTELLSGNPEIKVGILVDSYLQKLWSSKAQYDYEMDQLAKTKGFISIGSSITERFAEKYLMEKRNNWGKESTALGVSSVSAGQAAAINKAQDKVTASVGQYGQYNGEIFIAVKKHANNTVTLYNPVLGTEAKVTPSISNVVWMNKKATLVNHLDTDYLVTSKQNIISLKSGTMMKWDQNHGVRKEILRLAGEQLALPFEGVETKVALQRAPFQFTGKMAYSYGENKRKDVTANTTFDAILNGERTATTRYERDGKLDYWKQAKEGDIITWDSGDGRTVDVIVTKVLHKLAGSGKTMGEWSKLEGWSNEYFLNKVKPKLGEAWQLEFKLASKSADLGVSQDNVDQIKPC